MDTYKVLVTQANSKLGFEFLRQLVNLPHPPEYVFASYEDEDSIKDILNIKESSKKSKILLIKMDCQVFDDICEAKTTIQQVTGNQGLDFLINIINFTNDESGIISTERLERQFETYTLSQLSLFQIMTSLLAVSPRITCQESKAVFFNITEDNSIGSDAMFEINKVALHLSINAMVDKVNMDHVLCLSMCINTRKESHDKDESELENSVRMMLLQAFSCSQFKRTGI